MLALCFSQVYHSWLKTLLCRWFDNNSKHEVAVKIVPQRLDHLALQEIRALQEVQRAGVSRVANLLDHFRGSDGSTYLVLEYVFGCCSVFCIYRKSCARLIFCCRLVDGFDLYQYSVWRNDKRFGLNVEAKMQTVAVQLIEASGLSCWLM